MTELQASLIGIGSAIVVGVVSYNKWQEWRARRSVENAFSPLEEDVLMGPKSISERQEPVLGVMSPKSIEPDAHESGVATDQHDGHEDSRGRADAPFVETAPKPFPLDTFIDCVIPLTLGMPLRGEKITTAFHKLRLVGNKHVEVIGETETGDWEKVAVAGIYHALQVGVQLANRHGPLSELEYSELVTGLNQLSDELDATPELPEMSEVMTLAKRLYQLIHEFDVQLSINVRTKEGPWSMATIRPALQRQGLELRPDGRMVMQDGEGSVLYWVLTNANPADDTSSLMTLLLPVATVAPERDGFKSMTAFARSLANRLSGTVVDDAGHPLSDESLAAIAQQIRSFYGAMEQTGISPGSPRAQRLFA
ncbi:MAG: hypothetical protein RL001_1696 [Pseudomonadota bacterium]|jgi:hypothetical protein